MAIFDGKRPRFFSSVITNDGRWMIAEFSSGKPIIETAFVDGDIDAWTGG